MAWPVFAGQFTTSAPKGVIKVLSGSVVLAYVGPDGTVVTQVIMGRSSLMPARACSRPLPDPLTGADMKRYVSQVSGRACAGSGHADFG